MSLRISLLVPLLLLCIIRRTVILVKLPSSDAPRAASPPRPRAVCVLCREGEMTSSLWSKFSLLEDLLTFSVPWCHTKALMKKNSEPLPVYPFLPMGLKNKFCGWLARDTACCLSVPHLPTSSYSTKEPTSKGPFSVHKQYSLWGEDILRNYGPLV